MLRQTLETVSRSRTAPSQNPLDDLLLFHLTSSILNLLAWWLRHRDQVDAETMAEIIERAVLMARGSAIEPADLRLMAAPASPTDRRPMTLDEVELDAIRAALSRHDGNVVAAAEELGMSRSALYRRMEMFGL